MQSGVGDPEARRGMITMSMDTMSQIELIKQFSLKGVLHLSMNRPDVHNAFDDHQVIRLTKALQDAARDPDVKVVVLESIGKSFSAGGDVNYMRRMGENSYSDNVEDARRLATLMKTLNELPKPTIAKVQGAAMGGGVGLVCCCDIAIGGTSARLALSEIKIGMVPATIAPYVVRSIGEKASRRLFMTGEMLDSAQAEKLGFLSEVVADEELGERVQEIASQLLKNAPGGFSKAKQIIREVAAGEVSADMIEHTVHFIADIRDSAEGREGLSAFLEKRKPAWAKSNLTVEITE